ncbi:MAG TPA: ABC transporter substrate-binding protein [Verrucomicrobiae bacterium]|nr:ABC transporter substrate-binding protein [Verrucomicrobiae bacterium]
MATFAMPPGEVPSYILPFNLPTSNQVSYLQMEPLLFLPLYWFGNDGRPGINYALSIGRPPVFSNGGRTVTIQMRHYLWSDGRPVTNRDVEFWMNLLYANKVDWTGYVPGNIPDDLASMSFPRSKPYEFSLTFKRAYGAGWLLYNELSQIEPIPQHAWDRTRSTGSAGDYAATRAGARAVYKYLNGQSLDLVTYATNPLWKVVDGPWHLASYSPSTGYASYTPNRLFSGPDRPHIARFDEVPFSSDTAEFDALRAGELDYGYLPSQDLSLQKYFTSRGYHIEHWIEWGFNAFSLNYTNPEVGGIFRQLYIRQAMQHLINQAAIDRDIYHGSSYPTYGPVPLEPASPYLASGARQNPYPYSLGDATHLLREHGWTIRHNGVDTCQRAGTTAKDCGAGVAHGARLDFAMQYATGSSAFLAEVEAMKSSWSSAGIQVSLAGVPPETLVSEATPCDAHTGSGCRWQIADSGSPGSTATYSPQYLPTMALWIESGGALNFGGYSNGKLDSKLRSLSLDSTVAAFRRYDLYVSKELPLLWQPNYDYQVSVIKDNLHGAIPQDPNVNIYPQKWSLAR